MGKGLKPYARHLQRNLPGKPSYTWCLRLVTDLLGMTAGMSKEEKLSFLLAEARKQNRPERDKRTADGR